MTNLEQLETQNPINTEKQNKDIYDLIEGNENSIRLILNTDPEIIGIKNKAKEQELNEKQKTGENINVILIGLINDIISINRL